MQYNFVLIRTDKGGRYARKILNSVKWLNENKYPQHEFNTHDMTITQFMDKFDSGYFNGFYSTNLNANNTIIHARCANPRTNWTIKLRELEEMGYKVVNSVDTIELTSNKLACSLHLQGKVNHPKSWEYRKNMDDSDFMNLIDDVETTVNHEDVFIAKPLTSLEQGANVKKIKIEDKGYGEIREEINQVPGNKIVIQEYIPYTALHRVIVIGGKALPYTFIDRVEYHEPGDWKVSCCLNRTTMKLNENVSPELLDLAEQTQKEVGGVINFIDIFEYIPEDAIEYRGNIVTEYTNAEINTACSLNIHERLAKAAGRTDWNIHFRIAKELVRQIIGD
jgi:glutathione synthase/RimK-type ligase-like ATP-grasp enzyme